MDVKLKLTTEEHKDLVAYCNLNDLLISSVVKDSFTTGFNIERYGLLNSGVGQEKQVEKEVIVEKRVEIPVEVIKEVVNIEYVEVEKPVDVVREVIVEKRVEVPVEVIKEVTFEKLIYVTDQKELDEKISQKEQEIEEQKRIFSSKTEENEKSFQDEKNKLLSKIQELENLPPQIVEVVKETQGVDKSKFDALQQTVLKLRQETLEKDKLIKEYEKTINEIQKFQDKTGASYMKGSNLDDKLYR